MALSTAQEQYASAYLSSLMKQHPNGGYLIYNEFDNDTSYDLVIIVSDEKLFYNVDGIVSDPDNYIFNCEDYDYVYYHINTSNPSGYNPDYSDRIEFGLHSDDTFKVPRGSTVYTNAYFTDQKDLVLFGDFAQSQGWYNEMQNSFYSIGLGVLVCLLVFLNFFRWVFGKSSS